MTDDNDGALVQEWDEVAAEASTVPTKRVLEQVAQARARADGANGYFRDYTDTDSGAAQLWSEHDQARAEGQARSGRRPWLSQLMVTVGLVALLLRPANPYAGRSDKLKAALLQVAELAVAWCEAIDGREQEKRMERMQRKPWHLRLRDWWRARK